MKWSKNMKYKINKSKCAGCGACVSNCPQGAITIGEDGKAEIDLEKCVGCGRCKEICPLDAVEEIKEQE